MAANSTISVTFKITDADGSWKKLSGDAEGFKKIVESTLSPVDNLQKKVINWTAASQALGNMQQALGNLQNFMGGLTEKYQEQIMNETRLATVMKQRMGATDAEIQSIKELASAQQEMGVVGDEVQLAGLQQIATFVNQKSSLEKLAPAMNNLIAQQKGLNATTQDAQNIGNLFGKAMQGNISALSRVGITFSEAEGKVLKYGTEEEKAAMLAQVITQNVGEMNQELAKTDVGQQKQMANAFGDMQEQIGAMLEPMAGVVGALVQMGQSTFAITQLVTSFGAVANAIKATVNVQALLNVVMSANPIGIVVMAVAALSAALVIAYNKSEAFRNVCQKVWTAVKSLASYVWEKLTPAFEWLGQKLKVVWDFIKGIFGIKGDPFKDVKAGAEATSGFIDDLTNKYKDFTNTTKTQKPEIIPAGSIADYEKKMQDAQKLINNATTTEARVAAQKMYDEYKKRLDMLKATTEMAAGGIPQMDLTPKIGKAEGVQISEEDKLNAYRTELHKLQVDMQRFEDKRKAGMNITPEDLAGYDALCEKLKEMQANIPLSPMEQLQKSAEATRQKFNIAASAVGTLGGAMQQLGSPVFNVMGTIAQAIANIALAFSQAMAAPATSAGGIFTWIPAAATGLATMISTIASIKSATAFAEGGMLYGPTLALMGEYQGARNNPEVIAPLSKLQSMIGGGMGSDVRFHISGRDLEGVFVNNNTRNRRIR